MGILLLHEPADPPLMLVDFDDVRDPETGAVTPEADEIASRLGGFCEVSGSDGGIHALVRAELPGRLGKFIADLTTQGQIEMYDHGRLVGTTWRHVEGTPTDVPHCQETIDTLVREYETSAHRKRRLSTERTPGADVGETVTGTGADTTSDISTRIASLGGGADGQDDDTDADRSPYFDADIRPVADMGYFERYRTAAPPTSDDWQGPHPIHGGTSRANRESMNTAVDTEANRWYCFAHDSGGRTIELAAVVCDETEISCQDVPRKAARRGWLTDRPRDLLWTCLWLRDSGVVAPDARPPYAALVAVADIHGLHVQDAERGVLGEANADVARAVYDELEAGDVPDDGTDD